MPFSTGYRGTVGGAVQTSYTDQPGIAVPGMLAFASDLNFCDAYVVGEADGIAAGKGVKVAAITDSISGQIPNQSIELPEAADTAAVFAGIMVYDDSMQSDADGVPGWAQGRMARVLRPGRAGGRVFVKAVEAVNHTSASVNLVIVAGSDGLYEAGEFAPAALAGSAAAGYSVSLSANARWVSSAAAGSVACIELF